MNFQDVLELFYSQIIKNGELVVDEVIEAAFDVVKQFLSTCKKTEQINSSNK
jgi:hypothetical protein